MKLFGKGRSRSREDGMTLQALTSELKGNGFSEIEIKEQLLEIFGIEELKSFGEGAVISARKVQEVMNGLEGRKGNG